MKILNNNIQCNWINHISQHFTLTHHRFTRALDPSAGQDTLARTKESTRNRDSACKGVLTHCSSVYSLDIPYMREKKTDKYRIILFDINI